MRAGERVAMHASGLLRLREPSVAQSPAPYSPCRLGTRMIYFRSSSARCRRRFQAKIPIRNSRINSRATAKAADWPWTPRRNRKPNAYQDGDHEYAERQPLRAIFHITSLASACSATAARRSRWQARQRPPSRPSSSTESEKARRRRWLHGCATAGLPAKQRHKN